MKFGIISWSLLTVLSLAGMAEDAPCKDAAEVVHRAIARAKDPKYKAATEGYEYIQKTLIEESTVKGESKSKKQREWKVVVQDGHLHRTLTKADPPVVKEKSETKPAPKGALAKDQKKNPYDVPVDETLLERFEFTLRSTETFEGEPCYLLDFKPRKPGNGAKIEERFVNSVAGTMWIHAKDYEAMKIEFGIIEPIYIMGGIVGSCDAFKVTTLRQKLPDGVWMEKKTHASMTIRKLFTTTHTENETVASEFKKPQGPQAKSE